MKSTPNSAAREQSSQQPASPPSPPDDGETIITEDEALQVIVPAIIRIRLFLCVQVRAFAFTGPLTDMMLGEDLFLKSDLVATTIIEWMGDYDYDGKEWGNLFTQMLACKNDREYNEFINEIRNRRMRALFRCGMVCWSLGLIEEGIQDGEPPGHAIPMSVYKKMDDAMRGFLVCWCDNQNWEAK